LKKKKMSKIGDHFVELRRRLLYMLIFFILSFLCIYPFNNFFFETITGYLNNFTSIQLIAVEVASPFIVPLKLSAYLAAMASMPFWLYQVLKYMSPGLYPNEKSIIFTRAIFGAILFFLGITFCFLVVLPNVLNFFQSVGPESITVSTDISNFLSFVLTILIGFGIAFQVPVFVNALILLNIIGKKKLKDYRGVVLVICFVFGMLFTPPDVISQFLMAVPMYLLFEIGIIFSNEKKEA
tara:strand:+ start:7836 stop:8549 length:714 start_codon:yes stop_codon:yes gene_type:complete